MRVLFLFGAGASKYGGRCIPGEPPVGQNGELFCALRNYEKAPTWRGLSPALSAGIEDDFEIGMRTIGADFDLLVPLLREMAFYFLQFRPGAGQYYRRIVRACREARVDATFATTNYDMLIEYAIREDGQDIGLGFPNDPPGAIPVLKLHGSSGFVARSPGVVSGSGTKHLISGIAPDAFWPDEATRLLHEYPTAYPTMAVYAPGKPVPVGNQTIKDLQRRFARATAAADKIYIIGLSVNGESDPHIWNVLLSVAAPIAYVAKEHDDFNDWFKAKGNAKPAAQTFKEALPGILADLRAG